MRAVGKTLMARAPVFMASGASVGVMHPITGINLLRMVALITSVSVLGVTTNLAPRAASCSVLSASKTAPAPTKMPEEQWLTNCLIELNGSGEFNVTSKILNPAVVRASATGMASSGVMPRKTATNGIFVMHESKISVIEREIQIERKGHLMNIVPLNGL
jgi:hypothetical protein